MNTILGRYEFYKDLVLYKILIPISNFHIYNNVNMRFTFKFVNYNLYTG